MPGQEKPAAAAWRPGRGWGDGKRSMGDGEAGHAEESDFRVNMVS